MTTDDALAVADYRGLTPREEHEAAVTLAAEVRRLRPIEDAYVCLEDDVCMVAGGQPLHPEEDHDKNLLVIVDTLAAAREREEELRVLLQARDAECDAARAEAARLRQRHAEAVEKAWRDGFADGVAAVDAYGEQRYTADEEWEAYKERLRLKGGGA